MLSGDNTLIKFLSSIQLNPTYQVIASYIIPEEETSKSEIESIFYVDEEARNEHQPLRKTLRYPVEIVYQSDDTYKYHLSGSTWVHDIELGRGYFLISDSLSSGSIWRWEVGGGIITIGRSLFQKESGCRSNIWSKCPVQQPKSDNDNNVLQGSSGIAIQSEKDAESFHVGNLIVAEKGERRIVRMEEDGARTPLVTRVPHSYRNGREEIRRLIHPENLVYTPFGDLLFSDSGQYSEVDDEECAESCHNTFAGLYRLKEVINIPSIPFKQSYDAHSWDNITHSSIELLYSNIQHNDDIGIPQDCGNFEYISSISLGDDYVNSIFIGGRTLSNGGIRKHIIMKVLLSEEEEANDGSHSSGSLFFDMTFLFSGNDNASTSVTVDNKGNVYATYPAGVVVIDSGGDLLMTIPFVQQDSDVNVPNSISFGHDGYLYITSSNSLMRLHAKSSPMYVPTDLIVPGRKKNNH